MNKRYIYESLTDYQKNDMLAKLSRLGYLFNSGFEYQELSHPADYPLVQY